MKTEIRKYLSKLGKKGGRNTLKNRGLNYYREIGKKAAEKRWGKKKTPVDNPLDTN